MIVCVHWYSMVDNQISFGWIQENRWADEMMSDDCMLFRSLKTKEISICIKKTPLLLLPAFKISKKIAEQMYKVTYRSSDVGNKF